MTTNVLSFDHLLPEGKALLPYQTNGVAFAAVQRRVLIADEMGLGKTWQALVALLALGIRRNIVIVVPSTLRGNWEREIKAVLPEYTVQVISGRRIHPVTADITVINYDVLADWQEALAQPTALVLDESHYIKNGGSGRSKAAQALADSVPAEGVVLFLSGTPYQNRPVELLPQLKALGVLHLVAPTPFKASGDNGEFTDRDWEFSFKFAFCDPKNETGHGYSFDGASNLDTLNERLRATCMVRRERQDVTGLKNTHREPIYLTLNGALNEYRRAEADIVNFLGRVAAAKAEVKALQEGDDPQAAAQIATLKAEQKALRAKALVTLGTLRHLAGSAKVEATVEWVENFLTSNPTKSIILFAWHQDVQAALVEALADYKPAQILGGQKDVEAQKARFQAKETRVIILGKGAQEGHTLTAASDVLFVEQPWHAGAEQQIEDRANRIGQTTDVVAWKLLAEGTVDEHVHALIENKRKVFKAGIIGGEVEDGGEEAIEAALLAHFQGEADKQAAQVKAVKVKAVRKQQRSVNQAIRTIKKVRL